MKLQIIRASIALTVFLVGACFFAFVAWCSGFNFDHRNSDVGLGVFMTTLISVTVAIVTGYTWPTPKKGERP